MTGTGTVTGGRRRIGRRMRPQGGAAQMDGGCQSAGRSTPRRVGATSSEGFRNWLGSPPYVWISLVICPLWYSLRISAEIVEDAVGVGVGVQFGPRNGLDGLDPHIALDRAQVAALKVVHRRIGMPGTDRHRRGRVVGRVGKQSLLLPLCGPGDAADGDVDAV